MKTKTLLLLHLCFSKITINKSKKTRVIIIPDITSNFSNKLEQACTETVESGKMTKDLAILISSKQKWLNTNDFLDSIKQNFEQKIN